MASVGEHGVATERLKRQHMTTVKAHPVRVGEHGVATERLKPPGSCGVADVEAVEEDGVATDMKQSLSALTASRRSRLFVQCILPIAIACGFMFPQVSQLTLSIMDQYVSWSNEGQPSKALPLRSSSVTYNESDPHVTVVEMAISRSTEQGVANALPALALTPGHHLRLEPLKGPARESIKDNAPAKAMAFQIGLVCQERADRQGVRHIHLFPALAASLDVLVSQRLNALCPIMVYEFRQETYKPSGTLR